MRGTEKSIDKKTQKETKRQSERTNTYSLKRRKEERAMVASASFASLKGTQSSESFALKRFLPFRESMVPAESFRWPTPALFHGSAGIWWEIPSVGFTHGWLLSAFFS